MRNLLIVSTLVLLSAFPRSGVASSGPSSDRVLLKPAAAVVLDDEVACEVLEPTATFVPRTPAPSSDFKVIALEARSGRLRLGLAGGSHSEERP